MITLVQITANRDQSNLAFWQQHSTILSALLQLYLKLRWCSRTETPSSRRSL